jgi:hypothetical protein
MKKCNNKTCKNPWKNETCFSKNKRMKDGLKSECKDCVKKYYENNKEKMSERRKNYYSNNKEKEAETNKKYRENNKEKIAKTTKKYRDNNKEYFTEYNKKYRKDNKNYLLKYSFEYNQKRSKKDPVYRARLYFSSSISDALKHNGGSKNGYSCMDFLPWTIDEFWQHMEEYFKKPGNEWMTKFNRGIYKINEYKEDDPSTWTWHLDHIIPHSSFKYTTMDCQEFRDCWALSNLQPLKSIENIKYGKKSK